MEQHPLLAPLHAEYERQVKLRQQRDDDAVKNLQKFAEDNPTLAHVARRVLAQHFKVDLET